MTGYFEQETLHLFALQLRLPCQIGIILKTVEQANYHLQIYWQTT